MIALRRKPPVLTIAHHRTGGGIVDEELLLSVRRVSGWLVELTRRKHLAKYVTKNSAPRSVFESVLAGTHRQFTDIEPLLWLRRVFDAESNIFDALLVDEAHRLNEKSGLYGNLGENQIAELIRAARCSIFFLDEDQRVTWRDIGERQEITREAVKAKAKVTTLGLASQFRCNGSNGYLAWLDNTLRAVQDHRESTARHARVRLPRIRVARNTPPRDRPTEQSA